MKKAAPIIASLLLAQVGFGQVKVAVVDVYQVAEASFRMTGLQHQFHDCVSDHCQQATAAILAARFQPSQPPPKDHHPPYQSSPNFLALSRAALSEASDRAYACQALFSRRNDSITAEAIAATCKSMGMDAVFSISWRTYWPTTDCNQIHWQENIQLPPMWADYNPRLGLEAPPFIEVPQALRYPPDAIDITDSAIAWIKEHFP